MLTNFDITRNSGGIPAKIGQAFCKIQQMSTKKYKSANISNMFSNFNENFEIRERCKGVHCVDLGESFPTSIYLQNLASIQPRTSPIIS